MVGVPIENERYVFFCDVYIIHCVYITSYFLCMYLSRILFATYSSTIEVIIVFSLGFIFTKTHSIYSYLSLTKNVINLDILDRITSSLILDLGFVWWIEFIHFLLPYLSKKLLPIQNHKIHDHDLKIFFPVREKVHEHFG